MNTKRKKAFTLIELLVVIVIVGILATISIASFVSFKTKATLAKAISFEKNLMTNLFAQSVSKQKLPVYVLDLEEGIGTVAKDTSGNNLVFSGQNDSRWSSDTPDGSNYSLNATRPGWSQAEFDQTQLTNQITVSGWIKPVDLSKSTGRGGIITSGFNRWNMRLTSQMFPEFSLQWGSSSLTLTGNVLAIENEWNHVVGTYDGTTIKVYMNGEFAGQKDASYTFPTSNYDLLIGDHTSFSKNIFFIDRLRVFPFAPDGDFE